MEGYSGLVAKILKNGALVEGIGQLSNYEPACLNLVATDWEARLENDVVYQDITSNPRSQFKKKISYSSHYTYENSVGPGLEIMVLGVCRFVKPMADRNKKTFVLINDSEPLAKITRAMLGDLGSDVVISNDYKFALGQCNPQACRYCRDWSITYHKAGYKFSNIGGACILDTRVYDGQEILNNFQCMMEEMFPQTFLAILRLKIDGRYSYGDPKTYRISGKISDIIGFYETKLSMPKSVNIGNLEPKMLIASEFEVESVPETSSGFANANTAQPLLFADEVHEKTPDPFPFENNLDNGNEERGIQDPMSPSLLSNTEGRVKRILEESIVISAKKQKGKEWTVEEEEELLLI